MEPDPARWPDQEIHLFGAGVDSGTFDYFTEAIVGKEGASRGDYTSSEDDNVIVQGVSGDEDALGYFGYAYYEREQRQAQAGRRSTTATTATARARSRRHRRP